MNAPPDLAFLAGRARACGHRRLPRSRRAPSPKWRWLTFVVFGAIIG